MDPSIIGSDAVQGEVFLPGQVFVFGGFALRANSLGHLEQIESYAPRHQVMFGSLNYTTDIRGDLIFDGFEPMSGAPHSHDEHDVTPPSDSVQEITPVTTPALNPEQITSSEDGWMDPATDSELLVSVPIQSDWAPIMEFTSADIFQHSPLGDVLNSLRLSPCQETLGRTM